MESREENDLADWSLGDISELSKSHDQPSAIGVCFTPLKYPTKPQCPTVQILYQRPQHFVLYQLSSIVQRFIELPIKNQDTSSSSKSQGRLQLVPYSLGDEQPTNHSMQIPNYPWYTRPFAKMENMTLKRSVKSNHDQGIVQL